MEKYGELLHKSVKNCVYERGGELLITCGEQAYRMDDSQEARRFVVDAIRTGYLIQLRGGHVMLTRDGEPCRRLAALIRSMHPALMLSAVDDHGHIRYADGDPCDLTLGNIVTVREPGITLDGKRILLWAGQEPMPHYTDRDPLMERVLRLPVWATHLKARDRRLTLVPGHVAGGKNIPAPYLYQLRWCVEHYGATDDLHTIYKALHEMWADMGRRGLTIDHLDGNPRNCCVWNLAPMGRALNAEKEAIQGIRAPYLWFSVFVAGRYTVLSGTDLTQPDISVYETAEDYIRALRTERSLSRCKRGNSPARIGYDANGDLDAVGRKMMGRLLAETGVSR